MLKHYLLLSLKVLVRRKFFTFISIFAISLTLMVLMIVTAMMDHMFAPALPESRQERTLEVTRAAMFGEQHRWNGNPGFKLFDRHARNLPGVELLSVFARPGSVDAYVGDHKLSLSLKRPDANYWRILDFTFIEGRPFTEDEVTAARPAAVINRSTRQKVFGDTSALGKTLEAGGQRFTVVGVVEDVSEARQVPFADVWVPYTTAPSDEYKDDLMGNFNALALARSSDDMAIIRDTFNARLARAELDRDYKQIVAPFETKFAAFARSMPISDLRSPDPQTWRLTLALGVMACLFLVLPTLNLININVSRIMERASEIGVRKAFGASSRTLVGQFVVENVLLTLVGGMVGLALAAVALRAINESGAIRYANFGLNLRVFAYGLGLALVFGILSGVYPAWRMSRLHPAVALRGGERR